MSLPIPDILQNAAAVLQIAKDMTYNPTNEDVSKLKHAAKKVSPDDIAAVLNEVGKVYVGIHNIQVMNMGSAANLKDKTLEVAIVVEFGLGPRTLKIPLPIDIAQKLVDGFKINMDSLNVADKKLILDVSETK